MIEQNRVTSGARASERGPEDDAIFIHGFTSSSSFWAQTVFPELAPAANRRLLAVDLLGFGDSPKPANCAYTLRDHVEAIDRSLIDPLGLSSFHLVSHSMGCTVAIALAARNPARVRSITLVAPVRTRSEYVLRDMYTFCSVDRVVFMALHCMYPSSRTSCPAKRGRVRWR
jgi:pimeloyl-ACP methyl ester carboxylesterase